MVRSKFSFRSSHKSIVFHRFVSAECSTNRVSSSPLILDSICATKVIWRFLHDIWNVQFFQVMLSRSLSFQLATPRACTERAQNSGSVKYKINWGNVRYFDWFSFARLIPGRWWEMRSTNTRSGRAEKRMIPNNKPPDVRNNSIRQLLIDCFHVR